MTDQPIQKARDLLAPPASPPARGGTWAVLGAAALAATAAVMMAGVMVLGPGVRFDEPAMVSSQQP